jgi:putative PIN family toxin of toxin-antitoxin system
MAKSYAVIDTNVLYSGLYSAAGASFRVLRMIEEKKLTPLLSTTILFEYEDILKRNQKDLKLSNKAVNDILDGLCASGKCRRIHFLWRPQLSDPKDDHVLELAVAGDCADIVTFNIKDFKQAEKFGITVLTPADFIGEVK